MDSTEISRTIALVSVDNDIQELDHSMLALSASVLHRIAEINRLDALVKREIERVKEMAERTVHLRAEVERIKAWDGTGLISQRNSRGS